MCDRCGSLVKRDSDEEKEYYDLMVLVQGESLIEFEDLCPKCLNQLRDMMTRFKENRDDKTEFPIQTPSPIVTYATEPVDTESSDIPETITVNLNEGLEQAITTSTTKEPPQTAPREFRENTVASYPCKYVTINDNEINAVSN